MGTTHEGISCDNCHVSNFPGKRYKCLRCDDFDLCSSCYCSNVSVGSHNPHHAMQCILTANEFEVHFNNWEILREDQEYGSALSFTCSICAQTGFDETTLTDHVQTQHDLQQSGCYLCPICVTMPAGSPNEIYSDLAGHLAHCHTGSHDHDSHLFLRNRNSGLRRRMLRGSCSGFRGRTNNSTNGLNVLPATRGRPSSSTNLLSGLGIGLNSRQQSNTSTLDEESTSASPLQQSLDPIADVVAQILQRQPGSRARRSASRQMLQMLGRQHPYLGNEEMDELIDITAADYVLDDPLSQPIFHEFLTNMNTLRQLERGPALAGSVGSAGSGVAGPAGVSRSRLERDRERLGGTADLWSHLARNVAHRDRDRDQPIDNSSVTIRFPSAIHQESNAVARSSTRLPAHAFGPDASAVSSNPLQPQTLFQSTGNSLGDRSCASGTVPNAVDGSHQTDAESLDDLLILLLREQYNQEQKKKHQSDLIEQLHPPHPDESECPDEPSASSLDVVADSEETGRAETSPNAEVASEEILCQEMHDLFVSVLVSSLVLPLSPKSTSSGGIELAPDDSQSAMPNDDEFSIQSLLVGADVLIKNALSTISCSDS